MIYIVVIAMIFAVVFGRRRIAKVFRAWSSN
jgi:Sec-independent protein translocase protein TatA